MRYKISWSLLFLILSMSYNVSVYAAVQQSNSRPDLFYTEPKHWALQEQKALMLIFGILTSRITEQGVDEYSSSLDDRLLYVIYQWAWTRAGLGFTDFPKDVMTAAAKHISKTHSIMINPSKLQQQLLKQISSDPKYQNLGKPHEDINLLIKECIQLLKGAEA